MAISKTTIAGLLEEKRADCWPHGACSLFKEIEDYSGACGRCGWSTEDHEYLVEAEEFEDDDGNRFWALRRDA